MLLLGRTGIVVDDAREEVGMRALELLTGTGIDGVRSALAWGSVDHVIWARALIWRRGVADRSCSINRALKAMGSEAPCRVRRMDQLNGLDVPQSLTDVCRPERLGLLVYDMQVGILEQIADREKVIQNVREVLEAARAARVRTYFTRHVTLPVDLMGVAQLRTWRAWQRVDRLEDVRSPFLPDAPQTQIAPELRPNEKEAVVDKLTLSAFAGTPLELALRGADVGAIVIVGVAIEIGIEPTVRHATDLGFIPVVVTDACAAGNAEAGARTMETLRFLGDALLTDVPDFATRWRAAAEAHVVGKRRRGGQYVARR